MVVNLGAEQAARYGWHDPQPADAAQLLRWERAERITDELQMPLYAGRACRQRADFAGLVEALTAPGRAGPAAGPATRRLIPGVGG